MIDNNIKFSIITVAKGRYKLFEKCIKQMWEFAENPKELEHIIAFDNEDKKMEAFLQEYKNYYPNFKIEPIAITLPTCPECNIIHYERRNIHRDYWNPIARIANGDVVMGIGNDALVKTKSYDAIILDSVKAHEIKYNHQTFQILIDDGTLTSDKTDDHYQRTEGLSENVQGQFCSWVILTKAAIEVFKGLCPQEITFSGADVVVYLTFSDSLINSQIGLRDKVCIDHISHYTKEDLEPDDIQSNHPEEVPYDRQGLVVKYGSRLDLMILNQIRVNSAQRGYSPNLVVDNSGEYFVRKSIKNPVRHCSADKKSEEDIDRLQKYRSATQVATEYEMAANRSTKDTK